MFQTGICALAAATLFVAAAPGCLEAQDQELRWENDRDPYAYPPHAEDRPLPEEVDPGAASGPAPVPSDAIVLFGDNEDLTENCHDGDGNEPQWKAQDGVLEVVPETSDIFTHQRFSDCQLHIEWMTNPDAPGTKQHRSNSGVFFGHQYEVQILDNYENESYADGFAGALYGQYPPLVDASRPPGEWQSFDIVYRAPEFNDDGQVKKPARLTVFHNGVLVQDNEPLTGPTKHQQRPGYNPHGKLPLRLQDHGDNPLWFRNIWVRPLE
jgi:hypothetical protein